MFNRHISPFINQNNIGHKYIMLFFEYMREVLNIRLNCQNNNKCPVDDVVHLYGACNIDFKKHYKEIHNIKLQGS